jgi:hypothetical protein
MKQDQFEAPDPEYLKYLLEKGGKPVRYLYPDLYPAKESLGNK